MEPLFPLFPLYSVHTLEIYTLMTYLSKKKSKTNTGKKKVHDKKEVMKNEDQKKET